MKRALNALGYPVGRRKARSLMREAGVRARYRKKYKITTNSNHKKPVFKNVLNRKFALEEPDSAYVSDITYIWTQEGWQYLAVFIDLFVSVQPTPSFAIIFQGNKASIPSSFSALGCL